MTKTKGLREIEFDLRLDWVIEMCFGDGTGKPSVEKKLAKRELKALFRNHFLELVGEDENDGITEIAGERCEIVSSEWTRGYNKAKAELREKVEEIK